MRLRFRALLGTALLALGAVTLEARPDPLSERKRPTLDVPPPAPPPRKAEPAAKDKEAERGVRTATEPVRPSRGTADAPAADGAEKSRPSLGIADSTYKLGPRDLLRVEVWNQSGVEYEWRPVAVSDDGTVYLPLLDNVQVGDLTVSQAVEKLTKLYDGYIIKPQVFIQIVEYNSRLINVTGEVKSPGRYPLKGELTLTELLAEAGDLTTDASKTVRLIRPREGEEAPEVREIDLVKIAAGDLSGNVKVLPGDEISVLPNNDIVYVSGAVKTEGFVEFEAGMTAQQAIILAGGLAEGSAGGRTQIFRVEGGKTLQFKCNVKDQKKPCPLKAGDILKVPRSIL